MRFEAPKKFTDVLPAVFTSFVLFLYLGLLTGTALFFSVPILGSTGKSYLSFFLFLIAVGISYIFIPFRIAQALLRSKERFVLITILFAWFLLFAFMASLLL